MDKIILVLYVGMKNSMPENFSDIEMKVKEYFKNLTEKEDIIFFLLPDYDSSAYSLKLDCINPKHVNKSVYDLILERIQRVEMNLKEIVDNV